MFMGLTLGLQGASPAVVVDPSQWTSQTTTAPHQIAYKGETFTFDKPVTYAFDATGQLNVASDNGPGIVSSSTPSVQVDGHWVHGAVRDPYGTEQGFDARAAVTPTRSSGIYTYTDALNEDPGRTGSTLSIAPGARQAVTKCISRTDVASNVNGLTRDYITILFRPAADFRDNIITPGPADAAGPIFDVADVDYTKLRTNAIPTGFPSPAELATAVPDIQRPDFMGAINGEDYRRIQNFRRVPFGTSTETFVSYSGDTVYYSALRLYAMHCYTGQDRENVVMQVIRRGMDVYGAQRRGFRGRSGAGQSNDFGAMEFMAAALLLGDAAMLAAAKTVESIARDRPRTIQASDVGRFVQPNGGSGQNFLQNLTARATDALKPWNSEIFRGFNAAVRYAMIGLVPASFEGFPINLIQGGTAAMTDGKDASAILGLFDRLKTWTGRARRYFITDASAGTTSYRDIMEAWRADVPGYGWSGVPDAVDIGQPDIADQNFIEATTGGISWPIAGLEHDPTPDNVWNGNSPVLEVGMALSVDRVQYTYYDGLTASGTLTTPTVGEPVYAAMRKRNVHGWGNLSYNHPSAFSGSSFATVERNLVTPTDDGRANAAPTRITQPLIHVLEEPYSGTEQFWVALTDGATLASNQTRIKIGMGLQAAHPAPTSRVARLFYEDVDGSDVWTEIGVGDDWDPRDITPNLTGKRLKGQVTITNSQSVLVEDTQIIRVPAAPAVTANAIVDLSMGGFDPIHFPSAWAALSADDSAFEHNPGVSFTAGSPGAIIGNKSAGSPSLLLSLPPAQIPAGNYDITITTIVGVDENGDFDPWPEGRMTTWFRSFDRTTQYAIDDDPNLVVTQEPYMTKTVTVNIDVPEGLDIEVMNRDQTGGTADGDVVVVDLSVVRTDPPTMPVNAISADGWQATADPAPTGEYDPVNSPQTIQVQRQGHDVSGSAATLFDDIVIMNRVRQPYPNQLTDTTALVSMSDFVYSGDTLSGVTNSSARVYPKPIPMWLDHDLRHVTTNSYTARLAVAHGHARMGRPVAAVVFTATDETGNSVSQVVTSMSTITYGASGITVPHFAADLDFTGLNQGEMVTIDAELRPWVGPAVTASVDFDAYPSANFCEMKVLNDRTGAYGTVYAYVDGVSGDDATGVASTDPVTAAASPYANIREATIGAQTVNGSVNGRASGSGVVIRIKDNSVRELSTTSNIVAGDVPLLIENDPTNVGRAVITDRGSSQSNKMTDKIKFKGVDLRRSGPGSFIFLDSGAPAASDHIMVCEDVVFDENAAGAYSGWIYRIGRGYLIGCSGDDIGQCQQNGAVFKAMNVIGCSGDGFMQAQTYHCAGTETDNCANGIKAASGSEPASLGKYLGFNKLRRQDLSTPAINTDGQDIGARGFALIGNVVEAYGSTGANAVLRINGDGDTNATQNVVVMSNTAVGERLNWLYNDTGNADKSAYCRWNIFRERNTKTDVFGQDGTYIGNWPAAFNVAHEGNTAITGSNDSDNVGPGEWLGEHAALGDVYGTDASPVVMDFANDKSRDGDALGGGDYTPGANYAGSVIPAGWLPHSHDLAGTILADDGTAKAGALQ